MSIKKKEKLVNPQVEYTEKQGEALQILFDDETNILCYGGSKGGGKSYLGAFWMLAMVEKYPGSRGLIGRAELIKLKQSTLTTLQKVMSDCGLIEGKHYSYNQTLNTIRFPNSSEILLMDLAHNNSDQWYTRLNGIEISHCWVDEAQEITPRCKNILMSLVRHKLEEFGIKRKMLLTCNPDPTSFLYSEFYKPFREGKLPQNKKFLPALPIDNPKLPEDYIQGLKDLEFEDPIAYKKYWLGLWEYESSTQLIHSDKLYELFSDQHRHLNPEGDFYLSCDISRMGADNCVYILWKGLTIVNIFTHNKQKTNITASQIQNIITRYNIPLNHVIIDEGGVSGGVIDQLPNGIIPFNNLQKAITGNYKNLKHEAMFKLAEMINGGFVKFNYVFDDITLKNRIMKELEQIIQDNVDSESKLSIIDKDTQKKALNGKSPDYLDAISFRMFFLLESKSVGSGDYYVYSNYIS